MSFVSIEMPDPRCDMCGRPIYRTHEDRPVQFKELAQAGFLHCMCIDCADGEITGKSVADLVSKVFAREHSSLAARIAALEAELAEAREHAEAWESEADSANTLGQSWMAHANALRDALEGLHADTMHPYCKDTPEGHIASGNIQRARGRAFKALAQTPAASLAAHDAEVLERAIAEITNRCVRQVGESSLIPGYNRCMDDVERAIERIRALAAQAQAATHSVPDGTSEVKP